MTSRTQGGGRLAPWPWATLFSPYRAKSTICGAFPQRLCPARKCGTCMLSPEGAREFNLVLISPRPSGERPGVRGNSQPFAGSDVFTHLPFERGESLLHPDGRQLTQ